MAALSVFRDLMSFLTTISPTKDESFVVTSARFMFLFPAIGALIGFLTGLYSFFTFNVLSFLFNFLDTAFFFGSQNVFFNFLTKSLVSVMTLAFLFVLTGLQHLDGLVDVGNALGIGKASINEKVKIAHAWIVTRSGAFMAIIISFLTLLSIFLINPETIIPSFIVAETSAKLAMVTCAWKGSPLQKGLGSIFINSMNNRHSLYLASLIISMFVGVLFFGLNGVLAIASGIVVGMFMIASSKRIFGGVTGDIIGATNEIARMIALFILLFTAGLLVP
jgi:adenosylcobinamide-GDP ribazoletransferase